jgi:type IV secretion system protein VirB9
MEVAPGGDGIRPSWVFDDGRFTYFRFDGSKEIPGVFAVSSDGEESHVNQNMECGFVMVDRVSPRFVLRLGNAVVGIWNDAPGSAVVDDKDSVDGRRRVLLQGGGK